MKILILLRRLPVLLHLSWSKKQLKSWNVISQMSVVNSPQIVSKQLLTFFFFSSQDCSVPFSYTVILVMICLCVPWVQLWRILMVIFLPPRITGVLLFPHWSWKCLTIVFFFFLGTFSPMMLSSLVFRKDAQQSSVPGQFRRLSPIIWEEDLMSTAAFLISPRPLIRWISMNFSRNL